MLVVIAVNLSMTLEANRNRVVDGIGATFLGWNDVIRLHLDAAEAMADAATPTTLSKQLGDVRSWKCQSVSPFVVHRGQCATFAFR